MKLATIFVQVALVAVGILVYDHLRTDDADIQEPPDTEVVRTITETPALEEAPPPIVLEGTGVASMIQRQGELERRLDEMEKWLASKVTVVQDVSGYRPAGAGSADPAASEDPVAAEGEGREREFGEKDIAWFRDLKKQVEDIERHERYVEVYGRQLDRLEVVLTPLQRTQVIEGMIAYRNKQRDLFRQMGTQNMSREQREEALGKLQEEYNQTVYSLVPSAEAQKIIDSMSRNRSFGSRMRPGGGGRFGPR